VKISADRALYLSRILQQRLAQDASLRPTTDSETIRRALTREIGEAGRELETIEEAVRDRLTKRRGANTRDFDLVFARELEGELRKHGA
jgi:hypothetical protein